jgi:hypothetical protein
MFLRPSGELMRTFEELLSIHLGHLNNAASVPYEVEIKISTAKNCCERCSKVAEHGRLGKKRLKAYWGLSFRQINRGPSWILKYLSSLSKLVIVRYLVNK